MKTVSPTAARANIYKLIDEAAESHEPMCITGKLGNAISLTEEEWLAGSERHARVDPGRSGYAAR
ncbi:type II toxin-antitoxin system Phd/YefM family antitoxin [Citrifermentans bremense]|nr:type II toxin-antitoxin system Phd/YefM family antitoxin [Citrifermentans bremense]